MVSYKYLSIYFTYGNLYPCGGGKFLQYIFLKKVLDLELSLK